MSIYSNKTEQDIFSLGILAEQQKNQHSIKINIRISKQTHDKQSAENLSPIIKKFYEVNENTEKLGEVVGISVVEYANTQTPALKNINGTQSLPDTLTLMKRSKKFFKLAEEGNGDVFWNVLFIQPLKENRIIVEKEKFDISPNIQKLFTNKKSTTKSLYNGGKKTVFDMLNNVGFFDMKHTKDINSARMNCALYTLPKTITEIFYPFLPEFENIEDS